MLKDLDAFPPDIIIPTHAHYDHTQGIPVLREAAAQAGKSIEVMASHEAIPLLRDPSYQEGPGYGPFQSITDVTPLDDGSVVDLGGSALTVYSVPGHTKEHIAILDESSGNVFVGDALGAKFGDNAFVLLFIAPFWDAQAFYSSIAKLRRAGYQSLCLGHFGYIYGDEAQGLLDEATSTYETWWRILEENEDLLDVMDSLMDVILSETRLRLPRIRTVSPAFGVVLGLTSAWNRLIHGRNWSISKLLLPGLVELLVSGYRMCKGP